MSDRSAIEWTDATWNPVRGCSRVSKGCENCYAERQALRQAGPGGAYQGLVRMTSQGPRWTGKVRTVSELLDKPLHWREPRMIFVDSMSDLFHKDVPDEFIDKVFAVMGTCRWHTFQVLTKRADRMLEWFSERWQPAPEASQRQTYERLLESAKVLKVEMPPFLLDTTGEDRFDQVYDALDELPRCVDTDDDRLWQDGTSNLLAGGWPIPNVWLGISAENQETFDERWPYLRDTPAAVRIVSLEPLLGPIDISEALTGRQLHQVIDGGESGPKAQPSHPNWFRSLRDQCQAAGVPYFHKQNGEWVECETDVLSEPPGRVVYPLDESIELSDNHGYKCMKAHGTEFVKAGKKLAGRMLDGREHSEYPK